MKVDNFESLRLEFKPVSQEHITERYVSWLNDPEVYKYMETSGGYSIEKLKEFVNGLKEGILFWGIHIKETGEHIGNIKIDPIDETNHSGEYGIMMGERNQWGKGYAKEASISVIEHCFNNLNLSKITLGVIEDNKSAVELYKKIGFSVDEIKPDYGSYDGKSCNLIRMSLENE